MAEKLPTYGGQAVIEGVMMRGSQGVAIAMRAPAGNIIIHEEELPPLYRSRITKIPFLRGLVILWDALSLGIRSLTIAANTQTGEDEKIEGPQLYLTLFIALALGVGLFFLLPAFIGYLVETKVTAWWGNLVEGILRLSLLIGYLWLIARMDEIKRVFSYHGAEHKTINAFEGGAELSPENVSRFSVEHPRCGTSFLLTLVVLSILFFSLLGPLPSRLAPRQPDPYVACSGFAGLRIHPLDSRSSKLWLGPHFNQAKPGAATPDHTGTQLRNAGSSHRFPPGGP